MAKLHFSDEILMAFADGELDEAIAASVEQAMATDPAIARQIAEFLRSRRLARSIFAAGTASDVPPKLLAAIHAQIERFEGTQEGTLHPAPEDPAPESMHPAPRAWRRNVEVALAAGFAGLVIATAGYLVGRQSTEAPSVGPIAYLSAPEVNRALAESLTGQERDLAFGKFRAISTFRVTDGTLCREFKLHTSQGNSDAVACRSNDWQIALALASPGNDDAYVPSDGGDLMANYLQSAGASEPLLGAAEIQALSEVRDRR